MAKSIKKVQQEIEGVEITKRNIECFMNFKTLEECVYDYKHRYHVATYQREAGVWNPATKAYYITSLYEGTNVSPITICETEDGKEELTDGLQRNETGYELLSNKIRLPLTIPKEEGGGKYLKDAPEETINKIKNARVYINYVRGADKKQRQRIFLNLQKGEDLTDGQIISANYGHVFDNVEQIHNNSRFTKFLKNTKDLEWRTITIILMFETRTVQSLTSHKEISFVEKGYNQSFISKQHYTNIMKILDKLADVCDAEKIYGLSTSRTLYWYLFIKRNPKLMQENNHKLGEFLKKYHKNISVAHKFVRSFNEKVEPNVNNYYKAARYRNTSSIEIKLYLKFMEEEFERYCKGTMKEYTHEALLEEYGE